MLNTKLVLSWLEADLAQLGADLALVMMRLRVGSRLRHQHHLHHLRQQLRIWNQPPPQALKSDLLCRLFFVIEERQPPATHEMSQLQERREGPPQTSSVTWNVPTRISLWSTIHYTIHEWCALPHQLHEEEKSWPQASETDGVRHEAPCHCRGWQLQRIWKSLGPMI